MTGSTTEISRSKLRDRQRIRLIVSTLVGIALWCAHFTKAVKKGDGLPYPPMSPLHEIMFAHGRIASVACLTLIIAIYALYYGLPRIRHLRASSFWLGLLNLYLAAKLVFYGHDLFALQSSAVICLTIVCLVLIMSEMERNEIEAYSHSSSLVAVSTWIAAGLIIPTNLIAVFFYPEGALAIGGRMHGATGNPQHLAMICVLMSPAIFFAMTRSSGGLFIKFVSSLIFAGTIFIVYMTGSRMGLAGIALVALIYFQKYIIGRKAFQGFILGALVILLASVGFADRLTAILVEQFVEGRGDSRSTEWANAWASFEQHPIFGAPPSAETGRLIFVESSWISAASAGGVLALAISLLALAQLVKTLRALRLKFKVGRVDYHIYAFYSSALIAVIGVSTFEAALLGIFTTYTMFIYLYLGSSAAVNLSASRIEFFAGQSVAIGTRKPAQITHRPAVYQQRPGRF